MRRRWLVVAAVVPLAVVGGAVATLVLRGNHTTPVSVDDAVAAFRHEATTTPAPSTAPERTAPAAPAVAAQDASVPEPGVYAYATSGYEKVDALAGTRRDYPPVTVVTVRDEGCGATARWDVAKERWEAWTLCPNGGGITSVAFSAYHEFFGIGTSRQYLCVGDPRPVAATVGATWTVRCSGDGDTSTQHGQVLGYERLTVGATPVDVQHIRYDVVVAGSSVGDQVVERWLVPATGLVVREHTVTATTNHTQVGSVHFREEYTLELTSLRPRR